MLTRATSGLSTTIVVVALFLFLQENPLAVDGYDQSSAEKREIGYFWHVTDVFFNALYSSTSGTPDNACQAEVNKSGLKENLCGYFGESEQCSSFALIESIGKLFEKKGPADFYIFTGNIACPSFQNSKSTYEIASLLIANGLDANSTLLHRIYPSYGWYDYNPPGRHPMRYTRFYERMGEILRTGWPETSVLLQTRWHAGYFSRIQLPKQRIRVIVLNTNYYIKDHIAAKLVDPGGQWFWLIGQLDGCRANAQRAFLIMSIPPGFDELDELDQKSLPVFQTWSSRHTERYRRIIGRYRDVVAAQFAGHRHLDTYRLLFDDEDEIVSAILVAPPIEPRFSQLPGLRLYSYDTNTAEILNYVQYRFDLDRANEEMDVNNSDKYWRLDYVFRERYNLPNVSPQSLAKLLAKTRESVDDHLHRFIKVSNTSTDTRRQMNSSNRSKILWSSCAMANIEFGSFHECISAADGATSILPTFTASAALFGSYILCYLFGR